ncbi:MAG: hypothetical protein HW405_566 [Candidatus Berkelbacteria bacterium]|nr:hypothetical protein [Candidatus Berkelbacteria bacterium]
MNPLPTRLSGLEFSELHHTCSEGLDYILRTGSDWKYNKVSGDSDYSFCRSIPLAEYIRWEIAHLYALTEGEGSKQRITIVLAVKRKYIVHNRLWEIGKVLRDAAIYIHQRFGNPTAYMVTEYTSDRRTFFLGQGEKLLEPTEVSLLPQ